MIMLEQTLGAPDHHGKAKDTWHLPAGTCQIPEEHSTNVDDYKITFNGVEYPCNYVEYGMTKDMFTYKIDNLDGIAVWRIQENDTVDIMVRYNEIEVLETNTIKLEFIKQPTNQDVEKAVLNMSKYIIDLSIDNDTGIVNTTTIQKSVTSNQDVEKAVLNMRKFIIDLSIDNDTGIVNTTVIKKGGV